ERHIVETIKLFADNFTFNTIKDYPEVTPPFFYMFYALWAKIFSSTTESLRLLTLLISLITWQLIFFLIQLFVKKDSHAFLLSILIVINPYFFGISIFVYTDMFTIMLGLSSLISFIKNKVFLFFILSTLAILSRQYAVIIPAAVIVYSLLTYKNDTITNRNNIIASLISFIPLIILFAIWKNISPASGIEKWIVPNLALYNFDYINTYITFAVIYILPLVFIYFMKIKINYLSLLIAFTVTILLSLFPIKPSLATLEFTDYKTVGIVHQVFAEFFGYGSLGLKIILWIFLFAGCYINIEIMKKFYLQVKSKSYNKELILPLLWFLFLLIMPLSYQVWEKYLTMILPFYLLSIYLLIYPIENKFTLL
ncbi:MAG TPA: glycosyltransferase family 39 protein, partial [Ignavibacteriaceae bacterium]|nr:glycosyltransferase family 39 protein [Ignavibacteriaceae bacterium]